MSPDPPRRTIRCPHCEQEVLLDDAMAHELAAPLRDRWEAEIRQQVGDDIRASYAQDLADVTAKRNELEGQLEERDTKIKDLQDKEAGLLKAKAELEEAQEAWELEQARMRDSIAKEVREKATKIANERAELDVRRRSEELEEQHRHQLEQSQTENTRLKAQLERVERDFAELQRKSQTGSHTEAGYARQDRFADELQRRFPGDTITPVPRGQAGADVTQVVHDRRADCGTILWEVKRATKWQPGWLAKLAVDRDEAGAVIGVIVSEALPPAIESFGQDSGVWISSFSDAADLAGVLREIVITAWRHQVAAAERAGNAEKVYNYVTTGTFGRRFDRLTRVATDMLSELEQERRLQQQRWKRAEARIRDIFDVRDAVADDLIDVVGADAELPLGRRAELPVADMVMELPASSESAGFALDVPIAPN